MSSTTPPEISDVFQSDIHSLWLTGDRQGAINQLLARINAKGPNRPRKITLQFVYYLFLLGDLKGALALLTDLKTHFPQDAEVLDNLGVIQSKLGHYDDAAKSFEACVQLKPSSPNAWDGLAKVYSKLKNVEAARRAGEESLQLKDASTKLIENWEIPAKSPQEFLDKRPKYNVIAFSLWGKNPRYLRGALRNLLLIPDLYPGWTARLYTDSSIPTDFLEAAVTLGAEIVKQPENATLRQKLCWRFHVANDRGVGRFIIRDCDSVVSQRECRAVQDWLSSDRYFHVMRDWWTHTDLILAGMWGGVAGVLPNLETLLEAYNPQAAETANIDQWFLRDCLWDAIRRSVLIHDRYYHRPGSRPWPDADPVGNFHVGQDEYSVRQQQQSTWLMPWLKTLPCLSEME